MIPKIHRPACKCIINYNFIYLSILNILLQIRLSGINILDVTNKHLMRIIREQLKEEEYTALKEKITLKEWIPDNNTAKLLKLISDCKSSFHFMRQLSRTSVIPLDESDSSTHHNLLTAESIFVNL